MSPVTTSATAARVARTQPAAPNPQDAFGPPRIVRFEEFMSSEAAVIEHPIALDPRVMARRGERRSSRCRRRWR
jgi:hypothetical protein